jgi:hypothetical protein
MFPTPQKEAYAISIFKTCREIFDIKGSEEHKSIHGLEYAISCDTVSPGVKGVSTGVRGGIMGVGEEILFGGSLAVSTSARWEEMSASTLE